MWSWWRRRRRRKCRHKRKKGPRRLFWRVYAYGILILLAVTASVAVANWLVVNPSSPEYKNVARYVDDELTPLLDEPEILQTKLDRIHDAFKVDVNIFSHTGDRLARAGAELEPLDETPDEARWLHHGCAIPLDEGRAYLVLRAQWQSSPVRWFLIPLFVLGALALVTFPLARNIARPIEKVTQAAQALGEGHLDVRTGVDRRDEVGVLAAAFDEMATRLEHMVEGEKELRANVSHELRTPLARMRVALELAEEGANDPATLKKHVRGIRRDVEELEELVDQVLITARLDLASSDELALENTPIELGAIAAASVARFAEVHPAREVELRRDLEVSARGDDKLVRRVIDNLLENSAKYAEPDDGPIIVQVRSTGRQAVVSVEDHGIGVDPEDVDRLFEPFFRADSIRRQNKTGVGLGLSFCKRVIEAHGGAIRAEPRPGGGLRVSFALPQR